MYCMSVLYYTDTHPNGITTHEHIAECRELCVQQIVDKVNYLESIMGERTLCCKILSESGLETA